MATQPYAANRQLTLADLMAGGGQVAPVDATAVPQVATSGMSPTEQVLYDAIMSANSEGETRQVEKPNRLAQVFMGLGDAANSYASVKGNAPQLRTDNLGNYMQYLQRQNFAAEQSNKSLAEGKARRKLQGAEFLYGKEQQDRQRTDLMTERAAAAAALIEQKKAEAKQRADDAEAMRQLRLDIETKQTERDLAVQKATGITQEKIARINAGIDKTQVRMDKKDLGEAITFIGKTALNAKAMLAGSPTAAPMTPEQIDKVVQVTLDGLTLTPDARAAADAYTARELGPILHDHSVQQQNDALAAGSPMPSSSFNLTNWMKARGW